LVNDFDSAFPASAWWPVMTIKGGKGPGAGAEFGLDRELRWTADIFSDKVGSYTSPYVRFALAGSSTPISESFETGTVGSSHIAFALKTKGVKNPRDFAHPVNHWMRRIPATEHFVDDGVFQAQSTRDGGSAYPAFRVWTEPFTTGGGTSRSRTPACASAAPPPSTTCGTSITPPPSC